MRFLLDTNILIPLEDSQIPLKQSLANFVRLAHENGHQLVYHPASVDDIGRDANAIRRQQTLERLRQYTLLEDRPYCPWNVGVTNANDCADNEILYALYCDAVHALITEDQGIHQKSKQRGLDDRVYYIQTAEDWLRRLHERISVQLPNIEETSLYALIPLLDSAFFDSLRLGYPPFDSWFREKARDGRRAWVNWEGPGVLGAICIYARQDGETITTEGLTLRTAALKLSTFKVGPNVRGKKIGELFLKMAFRYATANRLEYIFIHGDSEQHRFLFDLLEDFGFYQIGTHPGSNGRDAVYLKDHPVLPPVVDLPPFNYMRRYFPHFKSDSSVSKFVVPIRPAYHDILFPDYEQPGTFQMQLFKPSNTAGNAIKLAYLCHSPIKKIAAGDIVLFYRSSDLQAITSVGVVEEYKALSDAAEIAQLVSRRTVYSMTEIQQLALKPTKVMLFRLINHFHRPVLHDWLVVNGLINGNIQSITSIKHAVFERIIEHGAG
jgi:GNAT superfamily N-acetyltransferase